MRLSNRSKKRMRDKALFCKATGDLNQACELLHKVIRSENKSIGLKHKKLISHSYVKVPQRVECTKSSQIGHFNQGDYYFTDLNLVYLIGERSKTKKA